MLFISCSGFPVPVSRYWTQFPAVEICDTDLALPGPGTIRRWNRESPKGFAFTVVSPSAIGESGFRRTKENKATCAAVGELAKSLKARAVVFSGPATFKPNKTTKAALKAFLSSLPKDYPTVVVDIPSWKTSHLLDVTQKRNAVTVYDPLNDDIPPPEDFVYMRLPGPAGHRSRYDEESVARIAEHCMNIEAETAFCVFQNIDMQVNATQLIKKLKAKPRK